MVLLGSVGSKVLGPGGDEVSRLDGDDGTVGVGDKSGEASVDGDDAVVVGVGVAGSVGERSSSNRVDGTASSGVGNLGSVHLRGVDGDDGSVGVADESSEVGVAGSVAEGVNRVDSASSSSVSGLGSDHVSGVGGTTVYIAVTRWQQGRQQLLSLSSPASPDSRPAPPPGGTQRSKRNYSWRTLRWILCQVEEGGSAVCDQDEDEEEQNIFTVDSTENLFQIV